MAETDDSPAYYVLEVEDPAVGYRARLIYNRDDPMRSWMEGTRFEQPPPEPIVLKLRGTDQKNWVMADLWLTPITVMSTRLLEAVRGAGVDNLDTYAVQLHDPVSGEVHKDYVAFNVVGLIAATDASKTKFVGKQRMIAADIDSLAIDEEKTRGALMFRLAESVNAILVHRTVCDAVEDAGIDTLTFYEPEDWAG